MVFLKLRDFLDCRPDVKQNLSTEKRPPAAFFIQRSMFDIGLGRKNAYPVKLSGLAPEERSVYRKLTMIGDGSAGASFKQVAPAELTMLAYRSSINRSPLRSSCCFPFIPRC